MRLGGDALHSTCKDAILKQTENARDEHPCSFHMGVHPWGIYVALCGNNQIEATKLRMKELTEAEGQTRLSLPAMLNVHMGTETISVNVLFYFFLSNIIFSVKVWCVELMVIS